MDLSINKLSNKKSNNLSFKGLAGAYDKKSKPILRFYAPPHTKDEVVVLELAFLTPDEKTGGYKTPQTKLISEIEFENDVVELPQDFARNVSSGFAYRYSIRNKNNTKEVIRYEVDPFRTILDNKGKEMNVIEQGRMYGVSPKGGTMRHSFLDSDVRLDLATGARAEAKNDFVRNHFNKLGGNIAGLNWLLKNTNELEPYRYFMTTPDIGADRVSSHRYWPANQYQCSDLEKFKELNFECFKQGKGYVADGAFTSQGIQSPLVQHVLKWGEESPFYHWLKIEGKPTLGVLPDIVESEIVNPYEHIGIRLVDSEGEGKPTYIQFYDNRLLNPDDVEDGKLHFDYNYTPENFDHYDITTHQDSVQPYAFEIDPKDKKLEIFKDKKAVLLKDIPDLNDFLTFPNYTIGQKNSASGATCWDGNVDIIKMNLSNPRYFDSKNVEGFENARKYLLGVADFWTEGIQSHLILETAKNPKEFAAIAAKNDVVYSEITKKENLSNFESLVLAQNKTALDVVKNFPLQSLETSEELSAIFAQPEFAKEFLTEERQKQIAQIIDSAIDRAIPEKFKDNSDYYLAYRKYVVKTYGNDILRNIYASALKPEAVGENGKIDIAKLREVTLKSLESYKSTSVSEERKQVVQKLAKAINTSSVDKIEARMAEELKDIDLDRFKIAEALVLQGKGGLNWRFDAAKDIGDLDAVRDKKIPFKKAWDDVQSFWGDFVARIKKHHPASYVINEVTSLGDFYKWNDPDSMMAFSPELAEALKQIPKDVQEKYYEYNLPYSLQVQYLNKTNSTTTSEFSHGFNAFSKFAGVDPESVVKNQKDFEGTKELAGKIKDVKDHMERLMMFDQPNAAIFSHMFTNNHDKPSVLHTLPLNMSVFMSGDMRKLDDSVKKEILELIGKTDKNFDEIYETICPKAAAVGLAMKKVIDQYPKEEKQKLLSGLQKLVNGQKKSGGKGSFKRAESFGVKPYEVTVKDLFEYSGLEANKENVLKFHQALMKDSMKFYERLWQVMNACVGTPTLYGGNEFAQTGYETPNKNQYLGIRNEVMHDLADYGEYGKYFKKMSETSKMYQRKELSALRDGTPISCDITTDKSDSVNSFVEQFKKAIGIRTTKVDELANSGKINYFVEQIRSKGITDLDKIFDEIQKSNSPATLLDKYFGIASDNRNPEAFSWIVSNDELRKAFIGLVNSGVECEMWPLIKYNGDSTVISVITNLGLPNKKASFEVSSDKIASSRSVANIQLKSKDRCPLEDGTLLKKYGDEKTLYVIKDGKIVVHGNEQAKVLLNDTVTTFYKLAKRAI